MVTASRDLSAKNRESDLGALGGGELDVLVVGGGVVGAGIALDAATRGLSVGLVEAQDWASGTSSRSTKLIHGGLRYLQMFDFYLVHEALRERGLLLERIAPHLVTKMSFLYPLRHRVYERAYAFAGISLYDALGWSTGSSRGVPRQRQLLRRHVYHQNPGLRPGLFVGGIEYYDAQVDDARFVVTLVRTAASFGAIAVNRTAAIGITREGDKVVGARLRDLKTGAEFAVRARVVILATGVWTEEAEALFGKEHPLRVRPSKGIHLVVAREKIELSSAVVTQTEKSFLFVIPWGQHWIIGTTDTPWDHDKARPVATASDIEYLLDHVNSILAKPLTLADVESVFAGLRPLIAGAGEKTTKLSREHAVRVPAPGLVAISGGKYTTYRIMAKDAVDAAVRSCPAAARASVTESTPLVGASGVAAYRNQNEHLATRYGLSLERIDHLIGRYGTLLEEVLDPAANDPSLLQALTGGPEYLRAEALYAVTHEGALHAEDVLRRRLRLDWETRDHGIASLGEVVSIMGDTLGWTESRRKEESEYYKRVVETELEAEQESDDATATKVMSALVEPPWVFEITR
jgi:glycerol-3-phosphate dehydrogenase